MLFAKAKPVLKKPLFTMGYLKIEQELWNIS